MSSTINGMLAQKILFAGCSFTADCGFREENRDKYHWTCLLQQHYNAEQTNIAIDGCSNDEIFLRSVEASIKNSYDVAIIMWSGLGRRWIYFDHKNIDDFTIINNGVVTGNNYLQKAACDYAKLHYAYFDNQYMNLKNWLLQSIALANFFKNRDQPYVFAPGFSNMIDRFAKIRYDQGFVNMDDACKAMLDLDNRPDDYVWIKVKVLQDLIAQASQLDWLYFHGKNFYDSAIDLADDQEHPGIGSNQKLYQQLVTHIDQRKLL
jgi:hypothetical protein